VTEPVDIDALIAQVDGGYPAALSPDVEVLEHGRAVFHGTVDERHHAANGFLHAAALVTLADTAAGFGALASLPDGATGFTTVELKSNHLSTIERGRITATATLTHGGRTTQVWDAEVVAAETGRTLAVFRCTQLVLYPRD